MTETTETEALHDAPAAEPTSNEKRQPRRAATPRGLERACAWGRPSGPARARMKETMLAMAGPPPPLPPREPNRRSRAQLDAEIRWTAWAMRAGLTKRAMMAALGVSKATCKRRLRAVRRELDWQIGDAQHEEALAAEWESRLATLRSGEVPPPLTPERELALMELAESLLRSAREEALALLLAEERPARA